MIAALPPLRPLLLRSVLLLLLPGLRLPGLRLPGLWPPWLVLPRLSRLRPFPLRLSFFGRCRGDAITPAPGEIEIRAAIAPLRNHTLRFYEGL